MELSNYFKKEASEKISDFVSEEKLEALSFSKSELEEIYSPVRFVKGNEILYKDELYDIYKTIYSEDSVTFYCLNDKNENILERAFSAYIDYKTQDNSKNTPITNILHSIMKVAITPNHIICNNFQTYIEIFDNFVAFQQQYLLDIPTPPPKMFS